MNKAIDSSLAAWGKNGETVNGLHPAWQTFVRFCQEVNHGEIERLRLQDGLPVLAEVTKKKVKFVP